MPKTSVIIRGQYFLHLTCALHISDFSYPTMLWKTMDLTLHKCIREGPYLIPKSSGKI